MARSPCRDTIRTALSITKISVSSRCRNAPGSATLLKNMTSRNYRLHLQTACAIGVFSVVGIARFLFAQQPAASPVALETSFEQQPGPFLKQNCLRCHNADVSMSGVRVDQLDGRLE